MKRSKLMAASLLSLLWVSAAVAGDGKKNVSLNFEGEVIERFNGNNSLLDSVNVTSMRQRERTRRVFKQKDFREEIKQSLREVNDIP